MLNTKGSFSFVKIIAFFMLLSIAACETKTETKVETTPVIVKDTVVSTIDTTAVPRPKQPGN